MGRAGLEMENDFECPSNLKGHKILVTVLEALPDILLVKYKHAEQCFEGALLDSAKRNVPCGIYPPGPKDETSIDSLYSVKQRFTYFKGTDKDTNSKEKTTLQTKKVKGPRMTVRLRPRQVLCSNCHAICNERNENVGGGKDCSGSAVINPNIIEAENKSYKELNNNNSRSRRDLRKKQEKCSVLVPKLIKLKPSEIETATNKGISSLKFDSAIEKDPAGVCESKTFENNAESFLSENECMTSKLKLSTNANKSESKLIKMVLPVNSIPNSSASFSECSNLVENKDYSVIDGFLPTLPKIILTTSGTYTDTKETSGKEKALKPKLEDQHKDKKELKLKNSKLSSTELSMCKELVPKLTIPLKQNDTSEEWKVNIKKRRSLGSADSSWEENSLDGNVKKIKTEQLESSNDAIFVIPNSHIESQTEEKHKPTVLKITFGPEGKGTVMKITGKSSCENDITIEKLQRKHKDMSAKAAKKALKKARKEAHKKALGGNSPAYLRGNMSPKLGSFSPLRLGGMSPGRFSCFSPARLCGASPGRFGYSSPIRTGASSPGNTIDSLSKKHRHKVKRKKRHKEERKHRSESCKDCSDDAKKDVLSPQVLCQNDKYDKCANSHSKESVISESSSSPKHVQQPSRQKLSISIKRVSNASYIACDPSMSSDSDSSKDSIHSFKLHFNTFPSKNNNANAETLLLDSEREDAPNFPSSSPELNTLNSESSPELCWENVEQCTLSADQCVMIGDVVWGKIQGYPWWPARVHYNKKKKGQYREAIRQAMLEAERKQSSLASPNVHEKLISASPREVDVVS